MISSVILKDDEDAWTKYCSKNHLRKVSEEEKERPFWDVRDAGG